MLLELQRAVVCVELSDNGKIVLETKVGERKFDVIEGRGDVVIITDEMKRQ
jgi:hypothetical protein